MSKLASAVAIALIVPLLTSGKRREAPLVGFHLEAAEDDRAKKTTRVVIGTNTYRVRLSPEFSQRDIAGYYPFLSEDGKSMGTAFKLTDRAGKRLETLTTVGRGRKIVTVVGTDAVDVVVIDKPVDDGYLICWKGLGMKHIDAFKAAGFKRIESKPAAPEPEYIPPSADDFSPDFPVGE